MMITADNFFAAKAIAIECGILKFNRDIDSKDMYGGMVVEGGEFQNYIPEEKMEKAESTCDDHVMQTSIHWYGVSNRGDMQLQLLVMTPMICIFRVANIGLAMGIAGIEVAKERSDIVILDDNFATVVNVFRWGRCIYKNMQKLIQFQFTVNVTALFSFWLAKIKVVRSGI